MDPVSVTDAIAKTLTNSKDSGTDPVVWVLVFACACLLIGMVAIGRLFLAKVKEVDDIYKEQIAGNEKMQNVIVSMHETIKDMKRGMDSKQ